MSTDAVMPGAWICEKCGFVLQKNVLHVADGSVTANVADECDGCPNDGSPMRALTWRKANDDIYKRCCLEIEVNAKLRAKINQMRDALELARHRFIREHARNLDELQSMQTPYD